MKLVFRWYGEKHDTVTLEQIRQIPGVEGVVGALFDIPVGEVWPFEEIMKLKETVEKAGLKLEVIESVNVHEDIKLGLPTRDRYIENYKETIRNLAKAGVKVVCYNFMPVFDWMRTDLHKKLPDGSETMEYDHRLIEGVTPDELIKRVKEGSQGFVLPGWEWDRLEKLRETFELYKNVDEEKLFENLVYFLERVIPVCEECDVKLAIHPDDPPWSIFGLPRIITNKENIERMLKAVDSPYNGITFCMGSLGANPENNIPEMIRYFGKMGRIHFAHVRNLKFTGEKSFYETAHPSFCGSHDLFEVMKAFHDIDYEGYIRPDHGRLIWGEKARPGYGLYDRALGATYILGLWEAIDKMKKRYC
ncbi:mannonate dehydratase [Thermotoga sp. 38H-to]|uniref:mannonate dehydratase n=1 Tax=Thermotoga sp. 38H-to TaxID=1755812 RepID=UPI0013EA3AAF|nr:mannonate dehydratase [Thermotoga sp. 38H-to]KAF2959249.1 mannonate dehydratase [Thermotoga sp. 38H-to]